MAIIVEDGTGVAGAESYVDLAYADAYWTARAHNAQSAVWLALTDANKEGSLREATDYLDALQGPYYRGIRAGYIQGKEWPRTGAKDAAGYPLPALPTVLQDAACELGPKASAAVLAADVSGGGKISKIKAGSVAIEYEDGSSLDASYSTVNKMLDSILDGTQPGAPEGRWDWK